MLKYIRDLVLHPAVGPYSWNECFYFLGRIHEPTWPVPMTRELYKTISLHAVNPCLSNRVWEMSLVCVGVYIIYIDMLFVFFCFYKVDYLKRQVNTFVFLFLNIFLCTVFPMGSRVSRCALVCTRYLKLTDRDRELMGWLLHQIC